MQGGGLSFSTEMKMTSHLPFPPPKFCIPHLFCLHIPPNQSHLFSPRAFLSFSQAWGKGQLQKFVTPPLPSPGQVLQGLGVGGKIQAFSAHRRWRQRVFLYPPLLLRGGTESFDWLLIPRRRTNGEGCQSKGFSAPPLDRADIHASQRPHWNCRSFNCWVQELADLKSTPGFPPLTLWHLARATVRDRELGEQVLGNRRTESAPC